MPRTSFLKHGHDQQPSLPLDCDADRDLVTGGKTAHRDAPIGMFMIEPRITINEAGLHDPADLRDADLALEHPLDAVRHRDDIVRVRTEFLDDPLRRRLRERRGQGII
jgi:hypothetical protein